MAERQIAVPTAGIVTAAPTFRVVASMNPYDNVGTTRLSTSVHDRICRLAIGYQDAAAERGIVALRAPLPSVAPGLYQRLVADAVAVTRATREHPDIRQGSSVRGAIDLTLVAGQLLELRGPGEYPELVYDAMVVALSGRIFLDETVEATPEAVLRQIWEDQFILAPGRGGAWLKSSAGRLAGAAAGPLNPARAARMAPLRRRPKQLDAEPRLLEAGGRGGAGGLVLTGDRGGRPGGPRAGSGGPAMTTERAGLSAIR